jgi:hypothetical protein
MSTLSNLEHLDISEGQYPPSHWQDDIENIQWLELLQPFSTVKNLYLPDKIAPHVAPALQELTGERVMEVLPALEVLMLHGPRPSSPVQEAIEQFVAAREASGHDVAVGITGRK